MYASILTYVYIEKNCQLSQELSTKPFLKSLRDNEGSCSGSGTVHYIYMNYALNL